MRTWLFALSMLVLFPLSALAQEPAALDPVPYAKVVFEAVTTGNWWLAATALLILVVAVVRMYGKKIHELLPDDSPLDAPFYFLFDTKIGGWVLNFLTTFAGGLATAVLAHQPITWALVKPVLMVALSGAAIWELYKDVQEWWTARQAAKALAAAPVKPAGTP